MNQEVIRKIQELVISEILEGRPLTEEQLARRLKVSRTPVREALSRLEEQRLVERRKNSGIKLRQPSLREMVEVYDLRTALEGMAARILAAHINREQLQELKALCQKYDRLFGLKHVSGHDFDRADIRIHQKLVDFCGNEHLKRVSGAFQVLTMSFHLTSKLIGDEIPQVPPRFTHGQILAALKNRNPDQAESLIRQHIQESKQNIVGKILGPTFNSAEGGLQTKPAS